MRSNDLRTHRTHLLLGALAGLLCLMGPDRAVAEAPHEASAQSLPVANAPSATPGLAAIAGPMRDAGGPPTPIAGPSPSPSPRPTPLAIAADSTPTCAAMLASPAAVWIEHRTDGQPEALKILEEAIAVYASCYDRETLRQATALGISPEDLDGSLALLRKAIEEFRKTARTAGVIAGTFSADAAALSELDQRYFARLYLQVRATPLCDAEAGPATPEPLRPAKNRLNEIVDALPPGSDPGVLRTFREVRAAATRLGLPELPFYRWAIALLEPSEQALAPRLL